MIQAKETPSFNLSDVWTATEEQFLGSFQGQNIGHKSPHMVLYILSELSTETEVITSSERVLSFLSSFLSIKLLKWLSLWTSIDFFIWIK